MRQEVSELSICCLEKTISGESHDQTLDTIESPTSINFDQLIPISNTDAERLNERAFNFEHL